ncbi:MAG: fimbrillin family protein [Bacteroidaceae bacterium]|nr:fimbrillin family protein [Bacteroidaceae bacterium]
MKKDSYLILSRYTGLMFMSLVCAFTLFSSCGSENSETPQPDVPLGFEFGAADVTRASGDVMDYAGTEFGVFASLYNPDCETALDRGALFMDNVRVLFNGAVCTTEKDYYWMNGDTHFAAYSPYVDDPESAALTVTVPQEPYGGYSFSGTVDGRTDHMFSDERIGGLEDFRGGRVPLLFRHATTKLGFSVRLSTVQDGATTWSVDVISIRLDNVRCKGDIQFTHGGETGYADVVVAGKANSWVSNEDEVWNTKEFPVGAEYDSEYLSGISVNNASVHLSNTYEKEIDDALYVMPQLLYRNGNSGYVQTLTLEYRLSTTTAGVSKVTEHKVMTPICSAGIEKWGINKYIKYRLVIEPGGSLELVAEVQPWELVESTNEFSSTVAVEREDRIAWTAGTYEIIDDDKVVLLGDISQPAEFKFKISSPLGGTWFAIFRTKNGDPGAFELRDINGNLKNNGAVGEVVTLRVHATKDNLTSVSNEAELMFVVQANGMILPVDILTSLSGYRNYVIVQNINK